MQAVAFASEYNSDVAGKFCLGVNLLCSFVETDQPIARILKLFHRPHEILHSSHGEMLERACRGSRNRIGQAGSAPLRDDDAFSSRRERRADNRAEILRVLNTIEQDEQRLASFFLQQVFKCQRRAGSGERDDALMVARHREAIELAAILEPDWHTALPRPPNDFFHPRAVPADGNHDAVERTSSLQRLFHRVNSEKVTHLIRAPRKIQACAGAFLSLPRQTATSLRNRGAKSLDRVRPRRPVQRAPVEWDEKARGCDSASRSSALRRSRGIAPNRLARRQESGSLVRESLHASPPAP